MLSAIRVVVLALRADYTGPQKILVLQLLLLHIFYMETCDTLSKKTIPVSHFHL